MESFQPFEKISIKGKLGKFVTPDGTIKDALRLDWGFREGKDEFDDLERKIVGRFAKDYPDDNILFEKILPAKCKDHQFKGELNMCRECHITPDLLLVYKIDNSTLFLIRLGSHSDLF